MRPIDADSIDFSKYNNVLKAIANTPTLEVVPINTLDEIKAEIENDWQLKKYPSSPFSCGLRRAIEIIDKYKQSRREKDACKES